MQLVFGLSVEVCSVLGRPASPPGAVGFGEHPLRLYGEVVPDPVLIGHSRVLPFGREAPTGLAIRCSIVDDYGTKKRLPLFVRRHYAG